jgi:ketosteroid isomerase-like protein
MAVAESYFAAFNPGDADALDAVLADDYVHHGALVAQQDREAQGAATCQ